MAQQFLMNGDNGTQAISNLRKAVEQIDGNRKISTDGNPLDNLKSLVDENMLKQSIMGRGLVASRIDALANDAAWQKKYPYVMSVISVDDSGGYKVEASYRFPINPTDLTITTPFATKLTITSRGVNEEHNGTPIRHITLNGTTGGNFGRQIAGSISSLPSSAGTIWASTISAVASAASSLGRLTGNNSQTVSQSKNANVSDLTKNSGWYQYHVMRLFLEYYAELKKSSPDSKKYRLALSIPKDGVDYLVTVVSLTNRRSAQSPMEYLYQLQFTAWGTLADSLIGINDQNPAINSKKLDVSFFQQMLNTITNARQTVFAMKNIVAAAQADIEGNIISPLNQTILLAKSILSIPPTIADMPRSIGQSFTHSVVANWKSLSDTISLKDERMDLKVQEIVNSASGTGSSLNSYRGDAKNLANDFYEQFLPPGSPIAAGINLNELSPSPEQQAAINNQLEAAQNLQEITIQTYIRSLENLVASLEPSIKDKDPGDVEWDLLYSLQDSITSMYSLISGDFLRSTGTEKINSQGNYGLSLNAIDFWQKSSEDNSIPFSAPNSKFEIPFPFKGSLEGLANVYLGDATRWTEIAAINGLQSPYIDEDGFYKSLIASGSQNQITLEDVDSLYVGQEIYLLSDVEGTTKRSILAIQKINADMYIVTVSGEKNLDLYKIQDNPKIKAYLPYTINSMKKIWIPSNRPSAVEDSTSKLLNFSQEDVDLVKFAKIDLLLDQNMDLAITSDGFVNLAFGATNLIQAAKIKHLTQRGDMILYPDWGAGIEPGESTANINFDDIIQSINDAYRQDPRFNVPSSIALSMEGAALMMHVSASVARSNKDLPITLPLSK